jgi:hypothetical protein
MLGKTGGVLFSACFKSGCNLAGIGTPIAFFTEE